MGGRKKRYSMTFDINILDDGGRQLYHAYLWLPQLYSRSQKNEMDLFFFRVHLLFVSDGIGSKIELLFLFDGFSFLMGVGIWFSDGIGNEIEHLSFLQPRYFFFFLCDAS